MRVHQLADELGITNERLGDFLESIGEKRSHLAGVSDEAAELAREHFALNTEREHPGHDTEMIAIPGIIREWNELSSEQSTAEAFAANPEGDAVAALTQSAVLSLHKLGRAAEDDEPTMPAEDTFHLVETREEFCLDPATAERLRAALKGRQLANACVHLDRCEVIAVTWPDYQKITVRTEG